MAPLALIGSSLFLSCSSPPASVVIARHHQCHLPSCLPPLFVDCCFKRSSLSSSTRSRQSPSSSAPANSRRFWWPSSLAVCCPRSRRFDVAISRSSRRCCRRSSPSAESFELLKCNSRLITAILHLLGKGATPDCHRCRCRWGQN